MEPQDPLPYAAKILREKLIYEEKFLTSFERNINSEDILIKRQAEGSIPSNKHRIEELKNAIEYLKTYEQPRT